MNWDINWDIALHSKIESIGAVILAGGKSSRMGRDKAYLPFRDMRLIDHMLQLLDKLGCSPVVVSGKATGYTAVEDIFPHAGPVGGIYAITQAVPQKKWPRAWLFVPVDMPLLTPVLLNRLLSYHLTDGCDGACFTDNPLPLFIHLHHHVLAAINQAAVKIAAGGQVAVRQLLEQLAICRATHSDREAVQLTNVNTPEDWKRITSL